MRKTPTTYKLDAQKLINSLPNVKNLIDEGISELRHIFPDVIEFVVDLFEDPECILIPPMIVVRIRTTADVFSASQSLKNFDEDWWLDNAGRSNGRLEFVVEFI